MSFFFFFFIVCFSNNRHHLVNFHFGTCETLLQSLSTYSTLFHLKFFFFFLTWAQDFYLRKQEQSSSQEIHVCFDFTPTHLKDIRLRLNASQTFPSAPFESGDEWPKRRPATSTRFKFYQIPGQPDPRRLPFIFFNLHSSSFSHDP